MRSDTPPMPVFESESKGPGIKEMLEALGRHWPLIVSTGILCLLVGYVYTAFRTQSYVSDARLYLVSGAEAKTPALVAVDVEMPRQAPARDNAIELMRSRTLANRVVAEVGYARIIGDMPVADLPQGEPAVNENEGMALASQRFMESFQAEPVRGADVIKLTYAGSSPNLAQDCLNTAIKEFSEAYLEFTRFDEQVKVLEKDMDSRMAAEREARQALAAARQDGNVYDLENERRRLIIYIGDLTKELHGYEDQEANLTQRIGIKQLFLDARRKSYDPTARVVEKRNPLYDERFVELRSLEAAYRNALEFYNNNSQRREVVSAKARADAMKDLLDGTPEVIRDETAPERDPMIDELALEINDMQSTMSGVKANIERLKPRLKSERLKLEQLEVHETKIRPLEETLAAAKANLDALREKFADVKTNQSFNLAGASNLKIVESPNLPLQPDGLPSPVIWLAFGLVGAILGLVIAFFKETVRETFTDEEELKGFLNVDEVIVFPDVSRSNLRKLPSA